MAMFTHALMAVQVIPNTYPLLYQFEVESPELLVESLNILWKYSFEGLVHMVAIKLKPQSLSKI